MDPIAGSVEDVIVDYFRPSQTIGPSESSSQNVQHRCDRVPHLLIEQSHVWVDPREAFDQQKTDQTNLAEII